MAPAGVEPELWLPPAEGVLFQETLEGWQGWQTAAGVKWRRTIKTDNGPGWCGAAGGGGPRQPGPRQPHSPSCLCSLPSVGSGSGLPASLCLLAGSPPRRVLPGALSLSKPFLYLPRPSQRAARRPAPWLPSTEEAPMFRKGMWDGSVHQKDPGLAVGRAWILDSTAAVSLMQSLWAPVSTSGTW